MRDHPLYALRAFCLIATLGSFSRAAEELDVSVSALSQAIRQIETRLGVRLLQRTTRHVSLTEEGRALFARIGPALSEIDSTIEQIRDSRARPAGMLRITVPRIAVPVLIAPYLADFLRTYPEIRLDLRIDGNVNDLIVDGFDAGIRLSGRIHRDMVALPLSGPQRSRLVASPGYLRTHGTPKHPRDLKRHNCMHYRFSLKGPLYRWEFAYPSGPKRGRWFEIDVGGNFECNDVRVIAQAAIDGIGMAHLMQDAVQDHLASGALVALLDDWLPSYDGFYLYYPTRFQVPAKLRAFADFFRERLGRSGRR
jgi:DNA-binding transcriptional LysR family regulator